MRRALILSLLLTPVIAVAEQGAVIDEASGSPLAGVIVVTTFHGRAVSPAHSSTSCYHVDLATSDAAGRFEVPMLSGNLQPWLTDRRRGLSFYKAGYEVSRNWKVNTYPVRMRPFSGSAEDRFRTALGTTMGSAVQTLIAGVGCEGEGNKLVPLIRAKHEEASRLAATNEQRRVATFLKAELESRTLGPDQAAKNAKVRTDEADEAARQLERGSVIEQATRRPLQGVIVLVTWRGYPPRPRPQCYRTELAVTDARGGYEVPLWPSEDKGIANRARSMSVYKAGYELSPDWRHGTTPVLMRPFGGTASERFDKVLRTPLPGAACEGAAEKLPPLARAMHEEAARLAETPEQRSVAAKLRSAAGR